MYTRVPKSVNKVSAIALFAAALLGVALPRTARAQSTIKNPHDHPPQNWELEPHGNLVFWRPYGVYGHRYHAFGDAEAGLGFRATRKLGDPAFIPHINNTVGISFGLDITNCAYCFRDYTLYTPVGMQWNFFFTPRWSAFADVGLMTRSDGFYHRLYFDFYSMAGGRYMFNNKTSLTMRVGYPFVSVGVSFFAG